MERKWNGKGTEMERIWNGNRTEMERKWNRYGTERERSRTGTVRPKTGTVRLRKNHCIKSILDRYNNYGDWSAPLGRIMRQPIRIKIF